MSTGYGVDLWCLTGVQPGRLVSGKLLVAQALYRRLTTPRGTLRGDLSYGYDVVGLIGAIGTEDAATVLRFAVRAEVMKDDRVQDVDVTVTRAVVGPGEESLTISLSVLLTEETESFTLTLSASDVSLDVVGGLPS
jgi:hypothetical protein